MTENYEKQVYTAALGKVIGVYLGRPFEGWSRKKVEEKWGNVTRYVHEDCNVPLVVPDDDITGTFTFIKVLADSGLLSATPDEFFGETWLNYLWENRTVLWWGGMGNSTEHTAYLRLKHGVKSPRSGSIELNSRKVAEQIGAQIFIDAFGMVSPGNFELAARMAEKAARVSHDGEAVYAAKVVAAMVSLAFELKDIDEILDRAVAVIPADCLIAEIHREVRAWTAADGDWRRTFARIDEKYGYSRYGGNCHVVPNHAAMVMAWAFGKNDFFKTMSIIASVGWDTDCNAANVGSVSALVAGLEHLCDVYDFRTPFADRLLLPTSSGDDSVTDVLNIALKVAALGREVMGQPPSPPPKGGAWHHFAMPGALHGYLPENGSCEVSNPGGMLRVVCRGGRALVSTPVLGLQYAGMPYPAVSTPAIYPGMTFKVSGRCTALEASGTFRVFVRLLGTDGKPEAEPQFSPSIALAAGKDFALEWRPELEHAAAELGFEIAGETAAVREVEIDKVERGGKVGLRYASAPTIRPTGVAAWFVDRELDGWISNCDILRGAFTDDPSADILYALKNDGTGVLVTGDRHWGDVSFRCKFNVHMADRAGILVHYQGMRRYCAVVFEPGRLAIVRNFYGETVLAETPFGFEYERTYDLNVEAAGGSIKVSVDGRELLSAADAMLDRGGAGLLVETGMAGFHGIAVDADWNN
ncbi:MAG: ADP-ribosylglycohydrolase family protein [Victivallaceae bacterium]|nr:ADP-ribosylglycohydrolase family protein [Victivallaceae bacterium]